MGNIVPVVPSPLTVEVIIDPHCECEFSREPGPLDFFLLDEAEIVALHHEPGKCPGTYDLVRYARPDGSIVWLCSACHLSGDRRLED